MRRISIPLLFVTVAALGYGLAQHRWSPQTDNASGRKVLYYVDPMHPSYRSSKPGIAPDCGMPLTAVFEDQRGSSQPKSARNATPNPGVVHIDEAMRESAGIHLSAVQRSSASQTIHLIGRVVPEDTRVYKLNSGVDGLIRATMGDSVGTLVTKDQKLAEYFAPDFLSASSGFLAASERVPGSVANEGSKSLQNYSDRLRNLGMSDEQIKRVAATRQLPENIDIVAPVSGVILARSISAGQHVERGMEFYRVADLSRVWVVADVYPQDQAYLGPGGTAEVRLPGGGRRLPARVTQNLPQSDGASSTVKVRLEVANPSLMLRPDMLVTVEVPVHLPPAITVPLDALIDAGTRTRVYVAQSGDVLEPREVEVGWRTADTAQILKGLHPGERVVAAATFLVDSESRLRTGVDRSLSTQNDAVQDY